MNNKNVTVLIYRIIAAIFILLCHIGTAINNGIIAQFFVGGVQFFLFISGYLYGNKQIEKPCLWLRKRFFRLMLPVSIYVLVCLIVALVFNTNFSWFSLPLYITDLQGYYHFFEFIPEIRLIEGTQHLWFLTVIFICYILTLVVQKISFFNSKKKNISLFIIAVIVCFVASYFGLRLDYVLTFFIGYFVKKSKINTSTKSVVFSFIFVVSAVSIRLLLKKYCDENGDLAIYTQVVVPLSCISIALFTYFIVDLIVIKTECLLLLGKIYRSNFLFFIANFTFYIYISHYIFIDGRLSTFKYDLNIMLKIVLFIVLSILLGLVLYGIDYAARILIDKYNSRKCEQIS